MRRSEGKNKVLCDEGERRKKSFEQRFLLKWMVADQRSNTRWRQKLPMMKKHVLCEEVGGLSQCCPFRREARFEFVSILLASIAAKGD